MNKKQIVLTAGAIVFALGLSLNLQYSMDGYGITENSLHVQVWAQSSGSGSSGACTSRGGVESKSTILRLVRCIKSVSGGVSGGASAGLTGGSVVSGGASGGINGSIEYGDQCKCVKPEGDYGGVKGCDYTWETSCK